MNPKRIIIVSFHVLIHSIIPISQRFNIFFALSNRKPIKIVETVKQTGRYLINYVDDQAYDLGLSICKSL